VFAACCRGDAEHAAYEYCQARRLWRRSNYARGNEMFLGKLIGQAKGDGGIQFINSRTKISDADDTGTAA
jgi:hypothetical protein